MAGFFNTNWDIGNMFNSPSIGGDNPYGFTGGAGGKMETPWYNSTTGQSWTAPSTGYTAPSDQWSQGIAPTPWGAPTGYQTGQQNNNIFNPYSAGGNNQYYNPYSFGQINSGTQYGGGEQTPWWMNYNQNNSVVNPPNIPTTSIEPEPQGYSGGQGTGPDGKDLNYAETIKYFGLYDNAESALAAGDKQAAYRKDHMQWRSGTGAWEGKGKVEGENDGDYPGRPDLGIAGDKKRMADLMGFPSALVDQFKGLFSGSGSGMNSNFLNQERGVEGSVPMLPTQQQTMQSYLDDSQKFSMRNYDVNTLLAMEEAGTLPSNITRVIDGDVDPFNQESNYNYTTPSSPFNQESNYNYTTPSPYTPRFPSPFNQNNNYEYFQDLGGNEPLIMSQSMTAEEQAMNGTNRSLFGIGKENFVPETRYGVNNSRELIESNLSGVNKPTAVEDAYNQRRLLLMRQESEKQAAMAESKRAAEEYEAQNRAEAAAKAAAEKARQATAAQKRMNDEYETGPVTPNIFTTPKATTGYTTKDVNNSFAARRNIRNIFA